MINWLFNKLFIVAVANFFIFVGLYFCLDINWPEYVMYLAAINADWIGDLITINSNYITCTVESIVFNLQQPIN
jgi:hypothetical protein